MSMYLRRTPLAQSLLAAIASLVLASPLAAGAPEATALPPQFLVNSHTAGYQFPYGATRLAGGGLGAAGRRRTAMSQYRDRP